MAINDSSELISQVVSLYSESGLSTYRIARTLQISRQRVARILRGEGVTIAIRGAGRQRPLKVDGPITEGLLRSLYIDNRLSSVDIGRAFRVSDRFVRSRLVLWGIERRTKGKWNRHDRADVGPEELRPLYLEK